MGLRAALLVCSIIVGFITLLVVYKEGNARITSRGRGYLPNILVTGGAGYIGSHATLRLLQDGHNVVIVDNYSRGNRGVERVLNTYGNVVFEDVDLGDRIALNEVFARHNIDIVIHFAAVSYVGESVREPLRYYHNVTVNTELLLEIMHEHDVRSLIYSSTCATYGEPGPEYIPISETCPQKPVNPYGAAKLASERMIHDYARSQEILGKPFQAAILRYFNVIGSDPHGIVGEYPHPELRQHSRLVGACIDTALGHRSAMAIFGTDYDTVDGTCVRDYVHVTDLVDAHVAAMHKIHPSRPHRKPSESEVRVYNVGTGKGLTVRQVLDACVRVTGRNITILEHPRRPGDYPVVYADPSKIKRELGWEAKFVDIDEAIRTGWDWRLANPDGYRLPLSDRAL